MVLGRPKPISQFKITEIYPYSPTCYQHHGFVPLESGFSVHQWEFQDPKMELLYHISGHILVVYPLNHSPKHRPEKKG